MTDTVEGLVEVNVLTKPFFCHWQISSCLGGLVCMTLYYLSLYMPSVPCQLVVPLQALFAW